MRIRRTLRARVSTEQVFVQIAPMRIGLLDQAELPQAFPLLELLLTADRVTDVMERFVEDQPVHAMPPREARAQRGPVATDPLHQVAGDADVERTVALAAHNVDVVGLASEHSHIIVDC